MIKKVDFEDVPMQDSFLVVIGSTEINVDKVVYSVSSNEIMMSASFLAKTKDILTVLGNQSEHKKVTLFILNRKAVPTELISFTGCSLIDHESEFDLRSKSPVTHRFKFSFQSVEVKYIAYIADDTDTVPDTLAADTVPDTLAAVAAVADTVPDTPNDTIFNTASLTLRHLAYIASECEKANNDT